MKRLFVGLAGMALVAAVGIGIAGLVGPKPAVPQSVSRANPVVMSGVIETK